MSENRIIQITDKLPVDEVCARLNVKPRSIRLARERGVFPASWFLPLRDICAAHEIECPEELFNWKSPSDAPDAGAA